jgi:photosystem II stability/assembly factor-like uncharacterized protein
MKNIIIIALLLCSGTMVAQNYWEPINFPDSLSSRAINAEKEGILFVALYAGSGYGNICRSYDSGMTWEILQVDPTNPNIQVSSMHYSPEGILFIGSNGKIYRSFDDGNSFQQVYSNGGSILNFNFSPSNEIFAVGQTNILRSPDNGITWDTLYSAENLYFFDIEFGINGELYTVGGVYEAASRGFYRSLDNGITWQNIGITDLMLYSVEVNSEGIIMVGGEGGTFTSIDNGLTWNHLNYFVSCPLETDSEDNLYAGQQNFSSCLLFSSDWGDTWTSLKDSIINPQISQISISPNNTVYVQSYKINNIQHQIFKLICPNVNVKQYDITSELDIYPNPTKGKLAIWNRTSSQLIKVQFYNQLGINVLSVPINDNAIDITNLPPGMYIVKFVTDKNIINRNIIKE